MGRWLALADEDLVVGEAIVALTLATYALASFHAQQASEKALKALLTRHGIESPKTHDLGLLLELAEAATSGIARRLADLRNLTPFAVRGRYPGEGPLPDQEEAAGHLALARRAVEDVHAHLGGFLGEASHGA